jgi:hypothetical protein
MQRTHTPTQAACKKDAHGWNIHSCVGSAREPGPTFHAQAHRIAPTAHQAHALPRLAAPVYECAGVGISSVCRLRQVGQTEPLTFNLKPSEMLTVALCSIFGIWCRGPATALARARSRVRRARSMGTCDGLPHAAWPAAFARARRLRARHYFRYGVKKHWCANNLLGAAFSVRAGAPTSTNRRPSGSPPGCTVGRPGAALPVPRACGRSGGAHRAWHAPAATASSRYVASRWARCGGSRCFRSARTRSDAFCSRGCSSTISSGSSVSVPCPLALCKRGCAHHCRHLSDASGRCGAHSVPPVMSYTSHNVQRELTRQSGRTRLRCAAWLSTRPTRTGPPDLALHVRCTRMRVRACMRACSPS